MHKTDRNFPFLHFYDIFLLSFLFDKNTPSLLTLSSILIFRIVRNHPTRHTAILSGSSYLAFDEHEVFVRRKSCTLRLLLLEYNNKNYYSKFDQLGTDEEKKENGNE